LILLGFGITNPSMLAWLAAAAVPVLVHLWSRRRYREVPWAAMQYLLAAFRRRRRRLLLEQWILLALRTLLIVLVVLAVAEPYGRQSGLAVSTGLRTHRLLILDASYSMAYRPGPKSRLERARELAADIVGQSPSGDAFTLIAMAAPPRVLVAAPTFDARQFTAELEQVQVAHTSADLPATLRAAEQVLQAARRDQPRLERHAVYFLSDLGRVGWDAGAKSDEVRQLAARLAHVAELTVVDVGESGAENAAVTGLRLVEPMPIAGRTLNFQVRLKNFGRTAQPRRHVELLVDGRRVQELRVDLAPGQETDAAFAYAFDTPGDHHVEARLEADRLDLDNHRWLALPVRESLDVLCINGRPSGEPLGGAADFLRLALAPADGLRTLIHAEVAAESALLERELSPYQVLFLCNVAQFTPSEAKVLDAYLAAGGNLVFFLGDRVLAEGYNRQLTAAGGGLAILPARIGPLASQVQLRLDPLGYRHPMLAAFRGREQAGLLTVPVMKHFRLVLPEASHAQTVLAMPNGDPLVIEAPVARGRVVLVSTSADAVWSGLPASPAFVPLVQEMLGYLVRGELGEHNVEVGQPLEDSLPGGAAEQVVTLQPPDGPAVPVRLDGRQARWTYTETASSGIYTARCGGAGRGQSYAVNLDTAESDLEVLGIEELRHQWAGVPLASLAPGGIANFDRSAHAGPLGRGRPSAGAPLHLSLLYAALGLLLLETVLAWRWGHHAS
jgi:hypothetical protein